MKFTLFILFLVVYAGNKINAEWKPLNTLKNIAISVSDQVEGTAKKLSESVPSPDAIFSFTKNSLAGVPFQVALQAVHSVCSAALSSKTLKSRFTPSLDVMNFLLMTSSGNFSIPFEQPELLWAHKAFDKEKPTEILVTGWSTDVNSSNTGLSRISKAYACRGGFNFIAIDTAQFVTTLYTWSAFNTEDIGKLVGQALAKLVENYPTNKIHLIGHSLGAHIAGASGREFHRVTGQLLPRITGLDPANPCFNEGEQLSGLTRGDAEFIDIIHSNNGALGKREDLGDADFYPNGVDPLPPGCNTIICAHARAYDFYAESVYPGNENGFMARKCNSISSYNSGDCQGKEVSMGFSVPIGLKGNYFLNTKSKSPFGKQSKQINELVCNDKNVTVTEIDYIFD